MDVGKNIRDGLSVQDVEEVISLLDKVLKADGLETPDFMHRKYTGNGSCKGCKIREMYKGGCLTTDLINKTRTGNVNGDFLKFKTQESKEKFVSMYKSLLLERCGEIKLEF